MSQPHGMLASGSHKEARMQEARIVFQKYPDVISKELQAKVLSQVVDIGMDPYMAKLAGGPCSYKISADPKKWPAGADPEVVMNAQSLHPDAIQIFLRFRI